MVARPTHTNPVGPTFSIKVPTGWLAVATTISRKNYIQGCEIAFDIVQPESRIFGSKPGVINDMMKSTLDNATSIPFIEQDADYQLDITFFFSANNSAKDAEELVDNDSRSSRLHVVKTEKQPGSFVGPDSVTFIVFVEDTTTQETGTGQFDDGVIMVHLVKTA